MAIDVLRGLNPEQQRAVAHRDGPLLVVAGAGSGKTRVITHRIANLIQNGVRPDKLLAITFTNKAAGEMQERVLDLLGIRTPWITTFHSAGLRILKLEQERLGLSQPFTILDESDQKGMMRRIIKELKLDPKEWRPEAVIGIISGWKNKLLLPDEISQRDENEDQLRQAYRRYRELCREECVFDFDDLLLETVKLLESDEELQLKYQEKFPYILVDEYQDTNAAQYRMIRLFGAHGNICATGDPDQAIYGWRGADIRNILQFEEDFPGCEVVLLEQNYRSTKNILRAAQAVIEHNTERKEKIIFSEKNDGDLITLATVDDQDDEAMGVAAAIDRLHSQQGVRLRDMAVFYRVNAQSRTLEEWLVRRGIPYRLVGGTRFYERQEIKDLLAYLRLMVNPRDLGSFLRVVNTPRRGLGEKAVNDLRARAYNAGVSIVELLTDPDIRDQVAVGRSRAAISRFGDLLIRLSNLDFSSVGAALRRIIEMIEFETWLLESDPEKGEERVVNVQEVLTAADQYDSAHPGSGVAGFLDHIALITAADQAPGDRDEVVLMTLHAAKGLEFPTVFITGLEQGVLPLVHGKREPDYEEERRLMYVGITRAQEKLYLSRANVRMQFGRTTCNPPSMFLAEIPDDVIEHRDAGSRHRPRAPFQPDQGPGYPQSSRAALLNNEVPAEDAAERLQALQQDGVLLTGQALLAAMNAGSKMSKNIKDPHASRRKNLPEPKEWEMQALVDDPYQAGDRVAHQVYGEGVVIGLRGSSDDRRAVIDFPSRGEVEIALAIGGRRIRKL